MTNVVTIARDNVIPLCPVERARVLARGWRGCPVDELAARCRALRMIEAGGTRLPTDVYNAYLCMRAVVEVAGRRR